MPAMTVAQALELARRLGVARLDAQLLLGCQMQRPRGWLLAHDDAQVDAADFATAIQRRAAGVPLAYLVGEREFHGLALRVSPAVLVPRPDTEALVDWALELLATNGGGAIEVADLGTGSGAIALAIKHRCPPSQVTATDASAAALAVAAGNADRLGLAVEFLAGDWWQPLAGRRFDLVLSNPPYIAAEDPHLPALRFEPRAALTPEGDGLAALRRIVADAPVHLQDNGWLLLEHGWDQADSVQRLLTGHGFVDVQTRQDLGKQPRCTGGRRPH
jgi:release factor glutamine methyltransferase